MAVELIIQDAQGGEGGCQGQMEWSEVIGIYIAALSNPPVSNHGDDKVVSVHGHTEYQHFISS